jgi:hypothetical protein
MPQETRMITKVKCGTDGCEWKDRIFTNTALFMAKIAPLDGPFTCPHCNKPMEVVERDLANYKPQAGAKTMPRTTTSKPTAKKPVGRKKPAKKIKIAGVGTAGNLRFKEPQKITGAKKPGPWRSAARVSSHTCLT